jgi:nicotinate-nucleotide adenylyltransferase
MTHKPRRRRVGILGGTFNPVHLGHLLIAQDAWETGRLDLLKFIPAAEPPHKRTGSLATARQRLTMIRRAIAGDPRFEVDDIEIKRGGRSYSVDTMRELRRREPDATYTFVIGSDSLAELHLWHDIAGLARLCRFLAVARPGADPKPPAAGLGIRYRIVTGHPVGISSSDIRRRCRQGKPIRYLVPAPVFRYIEAQRLYR